MSSQCFASSWPICDKASLTGRGSEIVSASGWMSSSCSVASSSCGNVSTRHSRRPASGKPVSGLFKLIPDLPPFSPSNHYNNENAFVELFISKEEHLTNKDLVESVPIISQEQVKAEDNKKVRCGVLYSLLKDKIGDDYSLSAIINYCCNIEYNKKIRQRNTNTIDKYIRLYKKRDLQKGSTDSYDLQPLVIEKVKRIIVEYDLEMPNGL